MRVKRREFIAETLSAGFLSMLAAACGRPAPGRDPASDHFFMLILTHGGMDVTLGLDPWVLPAGADQNDVFLEYRPDQITGAGDLRLAPTAAALAPFARRCSIINGIMMSDVDNGHEAMSRYMATGAGDGSSPDLPIELSLATPSGPFGVVTNIGLRMAGRNTLVSSTNDLKASDSLASLTDFLLKDSRAFGSDRVGQAKDAVVGGQDITRNLIKIKNDLLRHQDDIDDTEKMYIAAFLSGAARHAFYRLEGFELDTHENHEHVHFAAQSEIWARVARLFHAFESTPFGTSGESLFDRTTFAVVSEFSRTPQLNIARGKDHNPLTNSALLAGRGVRGGLVHGASRIIPRKDAPTNSPVHISLPIDYKDGTVVRTDHVPANSSVGFVYPENVIRTVASIMKADAVRFRSVGSTVLPIPGVAVG